MTVVTNPRQQLPPPCLLVLVQKALTSYLSRKSGGQRKAVLVPEKGCVAVFRLWMGVDQPEEPHPEPCPKVMGSLNHHFSIWRGNETIVAGCAGRGLEVFSDLPRNSGEIPFLRVGEIDIPVFALMVDIPGRNIRIEMALGAGIGFSSYLDRELVSGMAG